MSPKIFTALTLATAAAAGITALALHAPKQVECACTEEVIVAPDKPVYDFHAPDYGYHRHFARPPAPEPTPMPSPAPVA